MKKIQNKNICIVRGKIIRNVRRPAYTTGAFTLIELIVVITILAILGTIAFISLQGYSKSSRDSVRLSDIANIKKSLELFQARTGQYPDPTEAQAITYSGALAWYQGSFGNSTYTNVEKLNKLPVDPLTGLEYTYSVINTGKYYEIAGILESRDIVLAVPQDITSPQPSPTGEGARLGLILRTNAGNQTAKAIVSGTYNGLALRVNTETTSYILAVPSLITSIDLSVEDNRKLETIIPSKALVIKNQTNLPSNYQNTVYNKDGEADNPDFKVIKDNDISNIVVYEGDIDDLTAEELVNKFQEVYEGTTIDAMSITNEFIGLDTENIDESEQVDTYGVSFINAYLGGSAVTRIYNTCSYDETTYPHNTTKSFYSGTGVTFTVGTCDGIKQDYICKDGAWKDGNSNADLEIYQYTNCEVEGARTCTYLETEFNHGEDMDVYSQDSIDFGEDLVCDDVKGTVTCNDSIVGGHNTYGYKVCVKGEPIGCEAQPTYSYNGHEYNISILDHGDTSSGTIQESENNGTYEYTLSVTCNNGSYTAESEIGPDLVSCDTNYTAEGELCKSDCLADTYDGYDYTDIIHLETQEVSKDTSPINGTQETTATLTCSGGTVSVSNEVAGSITCDSGYYLASGTCEQQWSGDATSGYVFKNTSGVVQYPSSCSDLLDQTTWKNTLVGSPYSGSAFVSGYYWKKIGIESAFKGYCDMTNYVLGKDNYLENGDFSNGEGILTEYGSNPINNIILLENPLSSGYVLSQTGVVTTEYEVHFKLSDLSKIQVGDIITVETRVDKNVFPFRSRITYSDGTYNILNTSAGYTIETKIIGGTTWYKQMKTISVLKSGITNYSWFMGWDVVKDYNATGLKLQIKSPTYRELCSDGYYYRDGVCKVGLEPKYEPGRNNPNISTALLGNGVLWSDGTYGTSCLDYLNDENYNDEGDGYYWIKPDSGDAFKVYCDMTTDGGGWTQIVDMNGGTNGWTNFQNSFESEIYNNVDSITGLTDYLRLRDTESDYDVFARKHTLNIPNSGELRAYLKEDLISYEAGAIFLLANTSDGLQNIRCLDAGVYYNYNGDDTGAWKMSDVSYMPFGTDTGSCPDLRERVLGTSYYIDEWIQKDFGKQITNVQYRSFEAGSGDRNYLYSIILYVR